VLDESIFFDQFLEFGALDEVVILGVNFMWARFAGSVYGIASDQSVALVV